MQIRYLKIANFRKLLSVRIDPASTTTFLSVLTTASQHG